MQVAEYSLALSLLIHPSRTFVADVIKNDVDRIRAGLIRQYKAKEGHDAQLEARSIGDRINPDAAKNIQAAAAEVETETDQVNR